MSWVLPPRYTDDDRKREREEEKLKKEKELAEAEYIPFENDDYHALKANAKVFVKNNDKFVPATFKKEESIPYVSTTYFLEIKNSEDKTVNVTVTRNGKTDSQSIYKRNPHRKVDLSKLDFSHIKWPGNNDTDGPGNKDTEGGKVARKMKTKRTKSKRTKSRKTKRRYKNFRKY
jgi:hypothetical protein